MKTGTSWMTTLAGVLLGTGLAMQGLDNPTLKTIGIIVAAAAGAFLGISAKDKNVTGGTIQKSE